MNRYVAQMDILSDSETISLLSFSIIMGDYSDMHKYQFTTLWFDPTWYWTRDLPHSRRASYSLQHIGGYKWLSRHVTHAYNYIANILFFFFFLFGCEMIIFHGNTKAPNRGKCLRKIICRQMVYKHYIDMKDARMAQELFTFRITLVHSGFQ